MGRGATRPVPVDRLPEAEEAENEHDDDYGTDDIDDIVHESCSCSRSGKAGHSTCPRRRVTIPPDQAFPLHRACAESMIEVGGYVRSCTNPVWAWRTGASREGGERGWQAASCGLPICYHACIMPALEDAFASVARVSADSAATACTAGSSGVAFVGDVRVEASLVFRSRDFT